MPFYNELRAWTVDADTSTPAVAVALSQFFMGPAGDDGEGVPAGGTTGQVLKKTSNDDYATSWQDESGGGGGGPTQDRPPTELLASGTVPLRWSLYDVGPDRLIENYSMAADKLVLNPVKDLGLNFSPSILSLYIASTTAAGNMKFVSYVWNPATSELDLHWEGAAQAIDGAATPLAMTPSGLTFNTGKIYYFGAISDVACSVTAFESENIGRPGYQTNYGRPYSMAQAEVNHTYADTLLASLGAADIYRWYRLDTPAILWE